MHPFSISLLLAITLLGEVWNPVPGGKMQPQHFHACYLLGRSQASKLSSANLFENLLVLDSAPPPRNWTIRDSSIVSPRLARLLDANGGVRGGGMWYQRDSLIAYLLVDVGPRALNYLVTATGRGDSLNVVVLGGGWMAEPPSDSEGSSARIHKGGSVRFPATRTRCSAIIPHSGSETGS